MYLLININTWLPMYCGLGCLWLATILAICLPWAFAEKKGHKYEDSETTPNKFESPTNTAREQLMAIVTAAMWFARGNILVTLLFLTFLVTTLGRLAQDVLLQYITKRYGWSWAQASTVFYYHDLYLSFHVNIEKYVSQLIRSWYTIGQSFVIFSSGSHSYAACSHSPHC